MLMVQIEEPSAAAVTMYAENSLSENDDELNVKVAADDTDESELNFQSVDVPATVSISTENIANYTKNELTNIPKLRESFQSQTQSIVSKAKLSVTQVKEETSNLRIALEQLDAEKLRFSLSIIDDVKDNNGESSDDDNSYESKDDNQNQRALSQSSDFFTTIGKIPVVSEISLSSLENAQRVPSIQAVKSDIEIDHGVFVHPLTGQLLESTSEESVSLAIEEEIQDEVIYDKDEDVELSSFVSAKSLKTVADTKHDDNVDMALWFRMRSLLDEREDDGSGDIMSVETQHDLNIKQSTYNFLYGLIDKAVTTFEQIDFREHLIKSLDKNALVQKLLQLLIYLEIERRTNVFLNTKVTDYYRRKRKIRPITRDGRKELSKRYRAFVAAINELDFILGKESVTKQRHEKLINVDLQQLTENESMVRTSEDELETAIQNILVAQKSTEGWKACVARAMRKLAEKRDEVSTVRLKIIKRQHSLGELKDKIERIEFIGPAITLTMYERITSKITKLNEKCAEADASVDKVGKEYNNVLHFLAHIRENRFMLNIEINDCKIKYDQMKDLFEILRDRLHRTKLDRVALTLEAKNINCEVGLLDKSILLFDYDAAVDLERKVTKDLFDFHRKHLSLLKHKNVRHTIFN